MAELDGSIYFRNQVPDVIGAVEGGMRMGDMINQRRKQGQLDQAYKAGGGDARQTMSSLAQAGFGKEAMEMQDRALAQDAAHEKAQKEKFAHTVDLVSRVAPSIKDQGSYEQAMSVLGQAGVDISQLPRSYDPGLVQKYHSMALSAKDKMDQEYRQQQLANQAAQTAESRAERHQLAGFKQDEKMQGLKTPYGLANTEDDAKKLKEGHESKLNFDNKLKEMIALREKHGGGAFFNREDVERGKQLSQDLLLEYKNMAKLGVLSQSDEKIINAIIPKDPLEYNGFTAAVQGQDPILHKLKSFKADSDKDFQNRVSTRTREGMSMAQQRPSAPEKSSADLDHAKAIQWAQANPEDPRAKKILQLNQSTAKAGK